MAKKNLQEQWLTKTTEVPSLRQKLFGNTLQQFASAEQQLQTAVPKLTSPTASRGLLGIINHHDHCSPSGASGTAQAGAGGVKRANCMDHFSSKKPKHADQDVRMSVMKEFEATEKTMSYMHTKEE